MTEQKRLGIEILAVGTELLGPHHLDTNSLYLSSRLNDLGLEVRFKTVTGDRWEDLVLALKQALDRSDILFTIGGLGPTRDDRTREACAHVLGRRLLFDRGLMETIRKRSARRGKDMPRVNKKQAYLIEGAQVLANTRGTAPGLWVEHNGRTVVLLPGPPPEIQAVFEKHVWPRLIKAFQRTFSCRRVLKTSGLTESEIEERLASCYPRIPEVQVTPLARPGEIEIHLASFSETGPAPAEEIMERAVDLICTALGENVYSTEGKKLEEVIGETLGRSRKSLAVAESCTGGYLGSRITDVPGSSAYFLMGVVAYSNEAKADILGVPLELIEAHGAVSAPVAEAMARGIREKSGADYGLSITGIAGPGGGTPEKPVGLVFTALSGKEGTRVEKNLYLGDRKAIKFQSSQKALDMLRRHLLEKEGGRRGQP